MMLIARAAWASHSRLVPPRRVRAVPAPILRRHCSSRADGPDASRGFDIVEYAGLWHALSRDSTWPSSRTIAVLGPGTDAFRSSVELCCRAAAGCEVLDLAVQQKVRWQSVRVRVHCGTPDDFCTLHSQLGTLEGVKAIV